MEENGEELKECPICKAVCFADMDVCYGCLHSFTSSDNPSCHFASFEKPRRLPRPLVSGVSEDLSQQVVSQQTTITTGDSVENPSSPNEWSQPQRTIVTSDEFEIIITVKKRSN